MGGLVLISLLGWCSMIVAFYCRRDGQIGHFTVQSSSHRRASPGHATSFSTGVHPLCILCITDSVHPFALVFLTISSSRLYAMFHCRIFENPDETLFGLVVLGYIWDLRESLQSMSTSYNRREAIRTLFMDRLCLTLFCQPLNMMSAALSVFSSIHL